MGWLAERIISALSWLAGQIGDAIVWLAGQIGDAFSWLVSGVWFSDILSGWIVWLEGAWPYASGISGYFIEISAAVANALAIVGYSGYFIDLPLLAYAIAILIPVELVLLAVKLYFAILRFIPVAR